MAVLAGVIKELRRIFERLLKIHRQSKHLVRSKKASYCNHKFLHTNILWLQRLRLLSQEECKDSELHKKNEKQEE